MDSKDKGDERTIARFPPPPSYYTKFTSPTVMQPPDWKKINKLNSFRTFGIEYKIKQMNNFFNPVEIHSLKRLPENLVNSANIKQVDYFKNINDSIHDSTQNYIPINNNDLTFNIIKELEGEVVFLKERYKLWIGYLNTNIEKCEYESCWIKLSFQKIFFYLSLLKKKRALKDTIDYFKSEIDKNTNLEDRWNENINNFLTILIEGLGKIKE